MAFVPSLLVAVVLCWKGRIWIRALPAMLLGGGIIVATTGVWMMFPVGSITTIKVVVAVHAAAARAVARARAGEGPTLIECKTYRHRRHTERRTQQDDRPPDEVAAWVERDPIERLVKSLRQQQGQLSEEEWQAMDAEILARIEAAVAFAEASPVPAPESALEDVFAD